MIDIACPACSYRPPSNMSSAGQERALQRHISVTHSITELPKVIDNLKEASNSNPTDSPVEPASEPDKPVESPKVPQEPESPKEAIGVQQRPTRNHTDGGGKRLAAVLPIGTGDDKKDRIAERAEKWGSYLYKDFNPLLVSGASQFIGIPEPWLKGGPGANGEAINVPTPDGKILTFWNPSLEQQLTLSEKDCKRLAKAGATFSESPMGQAVAMWLEHNAHYLALGAALWVAGSYGWRAMRIKTEVAQLKELIAQSQQGMPQPGAAENPAA